MTPTRTEPLRAGTVPAVPVPDNDRPVRRTKRTDLGDELDRGFAEADKANERRPNPHDGHKGGTGRSAAPGSTRAHTELGFPATREDGSIVQILKTRDENGVRILLAAAAVEYVAVGPDRHVVALRSTVQAQHPDLPLAQAVLLYH